MQLICNQPIPVRIRVAALGGMKMDRDEVFATIEAWYYDWKGKITDDGVPHRFGFAKEELKQRLLGE